MRDRFAVFLDSDAASQAETDDGVPAGPGVTLMLLTTATGGTLMLIWGVVEFVRWVCA